jgi:cytochrome c peroxidase
LQKKNPKDSLFAAIDADDPKAETLTFEHLKKGLIRVWLTLPANMDLIGEGGNVITPPDRKIFVWRAVPSIADVALTAPYQLDGREATLEQQAQGAVTSHSEGGTVSNKELKRIADFEQGVFSSERARWVSLGAEGDVESWLVLSPQEQRGREVYKNVCESCHGGSDKTTIVDRVVHDMAFAALRPDGSGNVL